MTRVKIGDLPPAVQQKLLGAEKGPVRARRPGDTSPCPYRCHTCGALFPSYAGVKGFEPHADREGHYRGDAVLPTVGPAPVRGSAGAGPTQEPP